MDYIDAVVPFYWPGVSALGKAPATRQEPPCQGRVRPEKAKAHSSPWTFSAEEEQCRPSRFGELAEGRIFARDKMTTSGFPVWGVGERGNWRMVACRAFVMVMRVPLSVFTSYY